MLGSLERLRRDGWLTGSNDQLQERRDSMNIFKYLAFHASPICPLSRKMPCPIVLAVLIPLSQVNQNLGLAGQIRKGAGFEFFGRS